MKYLAATVIVVGLVCEFSHGQEIPRNKHLEFYDAYVGTWVKKGALPEDMPFGKKGDVGTSTLTWRWAFNKNAIDWRWEFDYAGKQSGTKGILTWDASQQKAVGNGVGFEGGAIRCQVKSTEPMTIFAEFVQSDGAIHSHVETFILQDEDTMVVAVTDRKGGPIQEDSPEYVFTRVGISAPSKDAIPPKVIRELRFMVGEWTSDLTQDGKTTGVGRHQRRWAPGKAGLIMTWESEENGVPVYAFAASGWNAEKKEVLEHWYDSQGGYMAVHYPLDKMTKDAWNGTLQWVQADGTTTKGSCRLEKGDGSWVFTFDGEQNGKPFKLKNNTRKIN